MSTLMITDCVRRTRLRVLAAALALVAVAWPSAASADGHRARMTREVTAHLSHNESQTIDVIVALPQSVVTRLARDYGVTVKDIIEGAGTVLTVRPSQLNLLANDAQVSDISLDGKVYGRMALTTQVTGAD